MLMESISAFLINEWKNIQEKMSWLLRMLSDQNMNFQKL